MPRLVTLGADPELPVMSAAASSLRRPVGTYVPVCGLMGGDKGSPIIVDPDIGGWLEDGTMLELNPKPTTSAVALSLNIQKIREAADEKLRKEHKLVTDNRASVEYDIKKLLAHPKACEFGCSVDYSAYMRGEPRKAPMAAAMEMHGNNIRFAGGHVHLGIEDWPKDFPKFIAVRLLDLLMGLGYERVYHGHGGLRSKYYGLPGLYRETSYGIEYRTPHNAWLREVEEGAPYFLARLKLIGMIFGDFENTKESLIKLYNSVEWGGFADNFNAGDYSGALECIDGSILIGQRVQLADWQLNVLDHRDSRTKDGKRMGDLLDPGLPVAEASKNTWWRTYDWRQYDVCSLHLYRRGTLETNTVQIPADLVKHYLEELVHIGGTIDEHIENTLYVGFPLETLHDWLPRRDGPRAPRLNLDAAANLRDILNARDAGHLMQDDLPFNDEPEELRDDGE